MAIEEITQKIENCVEKFTAVTSFPTPKYGTNIILKKILLKNKKMYRWAVITTCCRHSNTQVQVFRTQQHPSISTAPLAVLSAGQNRSYHTRKKGPFNSTEITGDLTGASLSFLQLSTTSRSQTLLQIYRCYETICKKTRNISK